MRIVLLGAPGSGKGTQAALISQRLGIPAISTGDMLRMNIREGTQLGLEAKSFMDAGELVPDFVILGMVEARFAESDCAEGCLLDGFPRTLPQAEALEKMAPTDCALLIDVPDSHIVHRMTGRRVCKNCGRTYHIETLKPQTDNICDDCGVELIVRGDDAPETVRDRLRVYHDQTEPLVEFYKSRGKLLVVDGTQSVTNTTAAVFKALEVAE